MSRLADQLVARIAGASLADLASGAFLVDDHGTVEAHDAEVVAQALEEALAAKNQFAASEPALRAGLRREIAAFFEGLSTDRAKAFAETRTAIAALMTASLGPEPREVTSAAYSPDLQLAVLGLELAALREPILDVGCGPDAALVRFLRKAGKTAEGIDLLAPADATRASWLEWDYGTARWGTIVSHLGFTLHFMHQEMKRSDLAFEYGRAYMRIVRSLAPGGTFAYIPAVPFIEAMLPKHHACVVHVPLAPALLTESVRRVQEATGLVLDAAVHVTARS